MSVPEITARDFVARRERGDDVVLLDVREDWELAIAKVPGIVHIPMGEVPARLGELDIDKEVVVMCRSGRRSLDVAQFLQQHGYRSTNLAGGILAWGRDLDPSLPAY